MKFKNKKTGKIVETSVKVVEDMFKRNADYETIAEPKKELTVPEIKAKLDELGIEYDKNANKATLTALLPNEEE